FQNYPNPFNATTVIPFTVNEQAIVTLILYNIRGQKIAALIQNEVKTRGDYRVTFNGSSYPSGIYFVELKEQSVVSRKSIRHVKKIILMK
ncbi:MAG: T9SS type A sorting domain-containing protein, partial [Parcubacteria group bacterium]|nr:T9SS type A sorting domain-containing protein [Parcubacteria group bacterium]